MKTLTTLLLVLLNISSAYAEATDETEIVRIYDVEIIIFEDAHARYINSESWYQDTPETDELLAKESSDAPHGTIIAKPLTSESKDLDESVIFEMITPAILSSEYAGIKYSSQFNVLRYSAWRQTGLDEKKAFEVNLDNLKNTHRNKTKNTITGTLKVVLARYLHVYSELEYQRENKQVTDNKIIVENLTETKNRSIVSDVSFNTEAALKDDIYKIHSHRRMRSKELHYIDHPLVGILIQINPVEITQPEQL